jgi:putative MATE family efflux protein
MQDLTTGPVSRHLLKTSSFMLVTMVFQTLYFLVDLYWVGRLGKEAVAAVAIAGNMMFVVLAASQMLGVGTTTLVSHAAGRKDRDQALLVFNQAQVLSVLVAVAFFAFAAGTRDVYVRALSADGPTSTRAHEYLAYFIPALALQFGLVAMSAALRGTGNFKPGMVVQTASVVLNMILAPIFIFGWVTGRPMGVAGAALASLVSVVLGSAWLFLYFLPANAYLKFTPRDWTPRVRLWANILKIGLPAGAEFALTAVYLFVVYSVIRPFGASAQAGFGIGLRVVQSGLMPVVALGFSVAPVAGQNFAARRPQRVRETFRTALLMSSGLMLVLTVLAHVAPAAMVRFFSSDPSVVSVGADYLRIASWNFILSGMIFISSSMFQAMGNTIPSLVTSFTRIVLVTVLAFVLAPRPGFELRWVWYLSVASVTLQAVMILLLVRREFRLRLGPMTERDEDRTDVGGTPTMAPAAGQG